MGRKYGIVRETANRWDTAGEDRREGKGGE